MFAICIESSHKMGMGHLFRALNFADYLNEKGVPVIIFTNNDTAAFEVLDARNVRYEIVDPGDVSSNWETALIKKYGVDVWINDRLDTDSGHARNIKESGLMLATFDDRGSGAEFADLHIAALAFAWEGQPKGKKVLTGLDYLILSRDIEKYKRVRNKTGKIIITLGGSDTYGVTIKAMRIMKGLNRKATLHIGPSFMHYKELQAELNGTFPVIGKVPSLIETFHEYDLAVTGGGITPFEANASGLPCIIIANETFEIKNGEFLDRLGSSVFAGYHEDIHIDAFKKDLDIEKMSITGMSAIHLSGAERVYREIESA